MLTHSQRVDKIKNYYAKNKFFTVIVAAVILLLIGQTVCNSNKNDSDKKIVAGNESVSSEENTSVDTSINEDDNLTWHFYWSDLFVLVGFGGFCVIKIIQEKKKAREKL